jgi:hypothetical protein
VPRAIVPGLVGVAAQEIAFIAHARLFGRMRCAPLALARIGCRALVVGLRSGNDPFGRAVDVLLDLFAVAALLDQVVRRVPVPGRIDAAEYLGLSLRGRSAQQRGSNRDGHPPHLMPPGFGLCGDKACHSGACWQRRAAFPT